MALDSCPKCFFAQYLKNEQTNFNKILHMHWLYPQHLCRGVYSFRLSVRPFVCSFVCSFVLPSHSWNYFKVLCASNSSGVYLTNHSSESIHIWTIGTLEGRLSFHDSSPRGGARGQDTFKKCFSTFLLWNQLMQVVGRTWLDLVTWTCGSWSEGQHDLYFTVQWLCLISWRLFDVCTSYFGSMNQYYPTFDLKVNVGHCDLYSMVQWFCLISWILFDAWTLLFGIMSQYDPKFYLKKI